jgi:hypothetical protein
MGAETMAAATRPVKWSEAMLAFLLILDCFGRRPIF